MTIAGPDPVRSLFSLVRLDARVGALYSTYNVHVDRSGDAQDHGTLGPGSDINTQRVGQYNAIQCRTGQDRIG
jgi:hypothetical protein